MYAGSSDAENRTKMYKVLHVVADFDFSLNMSIWTQHCSDFVTALFWPVLEVTFFPVLSLVWESDGMEQGNDVSQKRKAKLYLSLMNRKKEAKIL